jgi:hypothetical protein
MTIGQITRVQLTLSRFASQLYSPQAQFTATVDFFVAGRHCCRAVATVNAPPPFVEPSMALEN